MLCNGPAAAGRGFDKSLTVGQLRFPPGQCKTRGERLVAAVAAAAHVTEDREVALSSLFAHVVLTAQMPVTSELRAAQRTVIASRFGGSTAAYRRALKNAGATQGLARSIISTDSASADRPPVRVPRASGPEIADFRRSAAAKLARLVEVTPAAPWLGRQRRGVAIEDSAPGQVFAMRAGRTAKVETGTGTYEVRALGPTGPLGTFPWIRRSAIGATLMKSARDQRFDRWLMNKQISAHCTPPAAPTGSPQSARLS